MAAIFIKSNNTESLKLLTKLAEQLGATVNKQSNPEAENTHAETAKSSKKVSHRKAAQDVPVPRNGVNYFANLRKRIKMKMTDEQIDRQIKSLREEWQKDI